MWYINDDNIRCLRIKGIGSKFFLSCGFHADGQSINTTEGSIHKSNYFITWMNQTEHTVQTTETCACNSKSVYVLCPKNFTKHHFRFHHTAYHILLHVIGDSSLIQPFKYTRISITWPRSGCKGLGNYKRRIFHWVF